MSAGWGGRTEDTRKEDLVPGSHQCKACWFPLIVPYHREVTDREVAHAGMSPPKPHRTEREEKGKKRACGETGRLDFLS